MGAEDVDDAVSAFAGSPIPDVAVTPTPPPAAPSPTLQLAPAPSPAAIEPSKQLKAFIQHAMGSATWGGSTLTLRFAPGVRELLDECAQGTPLGSYVLTQLYQLTELARKAQRERVVAELKQVSAAMYTLERKKEALQARLRK